MKAIFIHGFHRYAGLLVSLQILVWSLGGFFMAYWSFGDLYAQVPQPAIVWQAVKLSPQQIPALFKKPIQSVALISLAGSPLYLVSFANETDQLVDQSGQKLSPLSLEWARRLAMFHYTGEGQLKDLQLLATSSGNYVSSTPIYRAQFDDAQQSELYLDPNTGELLARRKALWFWYQWMWQFHLMKYTPSPLLNRLLLFAFAGLSFLVSATGLIKFWKSPPKKADSR